MSRWPEVPLAVLVALLCAAPSWPQQASTDDLKKDIDALSAAVKAMQKDLQEIKTLLQARAPAAPAQPENVVLDLRNSPSRGVPTAKLTLVEFSDYQCPFCARHVRDTGQQIEKEYVATGKVKHVFMDYPLESMHKAALKAAEAAQCAGEQGKYWEMHDRLFANQQTLEPWAPHAEAVGVAVAKFQECLDSGRHEADIRKDMAEAAKVGVTGTPSFVLAYTDPKSTKIKTLARLVGAQPFASFKAQIDRFLAEPPAPDAKPAPDGKPAPEKPGTK